MSIKKRNILRMLFKSRKGLFQVKEYNKKAKEFWKEKEEQMIAEVTEYMRFPEKKLLKMSKNYVKKTGFPELSCTKDEIGEFKRILEHFGEDILVPDFVKYATRTGFLTVVIAPALAAADGVADIKDEDLNNWLYGIGICLPVSADVSDRVLDEEVLKHPLFPDRTWIITQKLGAAILFYIGLDHINKIRTGREEVDKRVVERLKKGLKDVCEKQEMDYKAQNSPHTSLRLIEKIYEGKICEIEATVFGTMPSEKLDVVKTFEEGARHFAGELQVVDDIEDLLGDPNIGKDPEIPNPSFFLTFCIDLWNKGKWDMEDIMEQAAKRTLDRAEKYHERVVDAFNRLPKDFPTKPFFEITLWYHNKALKDKVDEFLKGKTYPVLRPKLLEFIKSAKKS